MRVEWFGIAEAAVEDGRGALALVGFNANIVLAPSLPAPFRRAIVLLIEDDMKVLQSGEEVSVDFQLTDPHGKVMSANNANVTVKAAPVGELPPTIQLAALMGGQAREYGTFRVKCEVHGSSGWTLEAHKDLFVIPSPQEPTDALAGAASSHE